MKKLLVVLALFLLLLPAAGFALTTMAEEEMAEVQGNQGLTFTFIKNGALGDNRVGLSFTGLSYTDNDGSAALGLTAGRITLSSITMDNSWEWSPVTLDVTATGNDGWLVIDPPQILNKRFEANLTFVDPNGVETNRGAGRFGIVGLNWMDIPPNPTPPPITPGYTNDLELFTIDGTGTSMGIWIGGKWEASYIYWMDDGYTGYSGNAYLKTSTFKFYNFYTTLYGRLDAGRSGANSYVRFTWMDGAINDNRNIEFGRIGVTSAVGTVLNNTNTLFLANIWDLSLSQDNLFTLRANGDGGVTMDTDIGFNTGNLVFQDDNGFSSYAGRYAAFNGFHMDMVNTSLAIDVGTGAGIGTFLTFYDPTFELQDFGFTSIQMGTSSTNGGGPSLCSVDWDNLNTYLLLGLSGNTAAGDPNGIRMYLGMRIYDWDIHFGDSNGSSVLGPTGSAISTEGHFYVHNIHLWDRTTANAFVAFPVVLQAGTGATSRLALSVPDMPMTLEFTTRTANASNVGNDIFMHQIKGSINFNSTPIQIYAH
ncbi:MAG: hypothetical protein AB1921_06270 [Thermodesulfobacteriota bacterium]